MQLRQPAVVAVEGGERGVGREIQLGDGVCAADQHGKARILGHVQCRQLIDGAAQGIQVGTGADVQGRQLVLAAVKIPQAGALGD